MKYGLTLLVFMFIFSFKATAQDAVKGYARYQKNEYDKAFEYYRDALMENENDIVANYGMSLLYSNNTFTAKYNNFTAFRYIRAARENLGKANDKELIDLNKSIEGIRDKVDKDYAEIEQKLFNQIKTSGSTDEAVRFIAEFPDSKFIKDVVLIRNKGSFEKIRKTNDSLTVIDCNAFIEHFPGAVEIPEAVRLRAQAAYMILIRKPELKRVYDYLSRYPTSEALEKVVDMRDSLEYAKAQAENTPDAFAGYIKYFPKSKMTPKAINMVIQKAYERAQERNSNKDYQDFINRYYPSDQADGAITLRDDLQFEEIKQTNTVDSYNTFITWSPNNRNKKEAIQLRNAKAYAEASALNSISAFEDFIYNYPAAVQVKDAAVMRDTLLLRQCLQLTSIDRFGDLMKPYPKLSNSPRAKEIIEKLEFKEAELRGTKEDYIEFIEKHPNSPYKKQAEERMKKMN
jgi:outer membrane protein assembly factor BamD (BamD/ComL family)